ncbi:MAG: DUF488 domain-containing protein [Deltaproteobacteria bacterium]|nr:DUF488 domain-containing protein [Deltaproteobacteria bacterium]
MAMTVYTIGHSTRSIESFIRMLRTHAIKKVVDIRAIARSRHNPQYNEDELKRSLGSEDIEYVHCPGLGGLRHTTKASINTGWRNASFRGYADYMQTPQFQENLARLIDIVREKKTAILCAEAVPWRCHRSLVADALSVRGITVLDILGETGVRPHALTPFAEIHGTKITYPGTGFAPGTKCDGY